MNGRIARGGPDAGDFNQLIWWMVLLKVGIVFVFLLLTTIFMIWFERRVIGRMQNRPGPNRAGPWGLLQPIADALKLPLKEDIVPTTVDKLVFFIAPIIAAATSFVAFAIIPVGPGGVDLPPLDAAAGRGPAGGGAAGAGDELDRRLRHRAGRLGVPRAVLDPRRAPLDRAGDQLRDRDGPVVRRGLPRRRDRCPPPRSSPPSSTIWYFWVLCPVVPHLPGDDGRRDQPDPVRPARGRGRDRGRPHDRVLLDEVRHVLPRRVHQHDDGLRARRHAVPRRLAGPVADSPSRAGRQQRLVAGALVPRSRSSSCCSATSGCAARCRGPGTTS